MAYDETLKKTEKEKKVPLNEGVTAIGQIYTYSKGPRRFKLLFEQSKVKKPYTSSKFPALSDKAEIQVIRKLLQEFEKSF